MELLCQTRDRGKKVYLLDFRFTVIFFLVSLNEGRETADNFLNQETMNF